MITLILLISDKSFGQIRNEKNLIGIARSFVEFQYDSLKLLNKSSDILFLGANTVDKDSFYLSICFLSAYYLKDVEYEKLYEFNGFKMIISDSMDKNYILKRLFKERVYENINKSDYRFLLHPKSWIVTLNNNSEVVSIESEYRFRDVVRKPKKKNKVKFAKNFHFIQNMSWQTDDR